MSFHSRAGHKCGIAGKRMMRLVTTFSVYLHRRIALLAYKYDSNIHQHLHLRYYTSICDNIEQQQVSMSAETFVYISQSSRIRKSSQTIFVFGGRSSYVMFCVIEGDLLSHMGCCLR